jgi:hypothetical protein
VYVVIIAKGERNGSEITLIRAAGANKNVDSSLQRLRRMKEMKRTVSEILLFQAQCGTNGRYILQSDQYDAASSHDSLGSQWLSMFVEVFPVERTKNLPQFGYRKGLLYVNIIRSTCLRLQH